MTGAPISLENPWKAWEEAAGWENKACTRGLAESIMSANQRI